MTKSYEELLKLKLDYSKYKDKFKTFSHSTKNATMIDCDKYVLLYNNSVSSDLFINCEAYISAHGSLSSSVIDIHDMRIELYGYDNQSLYGWPIDRYVKDDGDIKPLASLYNGKIHPYTEDTIERIKDPNKFKDITGLYTFDHIPDHSLSRYEESDESVKYFIDTIDKNRDAIFILIKQDTNLSSLLENLRTNFGMFKSYSLSFCRGDESYDPWDNNINRLSKKGRVTFSNIDKKYFTDSFIEKYRTSSLGFNRDTIAESSFTQLKQDLQSLLSIAEYCYRSRKNSYRKRDIFHLGYSNIQKSKASLEVLKGLRGSDNKNLSRSIIGCIKDGRLGNSLLKLANKYGYKSIDEMLKDLGFIV